MSLSSSNGNKRGKNRYPRHKGNIPLHAKKPNSKKANFNPQELLYSFFCNEYKFHIINAINNMKEHSFTADMIYAEISCKLKESDKYKEYGGNEHLIKHSLHKLLNHFCKIKVLGKSFSVSANSQIFCIGLNFKKFLKRLHEKLLYLNEIPQNTVVGKIKENKYVLNEPTTPSSPSSASESEEEEEEKQQMQPKKQEKRQRQEQKHEKQQGRQQYGQQIEEKTETKQRLNILLYEERHKIPSEFQESLLKVMKMVNIININNNNGTTYYRYFGDQIEDYKLIQVSPNYFEYNCHQHTLICSECDFSFTMSIINKRGGFGQGLCSTSYEAAFKQHLANFQFCIAAQCKISFEIDAKALHLTEKQWNDRYGEKFERILFTFPRIFKPEWTKTDYNQYNATLIHDLLKSAKRYLNQDGGEIHMMLFKEQFKHWRVNHSLNELGLELCFWCILNECLLTKHFVPYKPRDLHGTPMTFCSFDIIYLCSFKIRPECTANNV